MPLIDTTSERELELARGLLEENSIIKSDKPLPELLKKNRLDTNTLLGKLSDMTEQGENLNLQMRAIETGLKLNKVLDNGIKENGNVTFVININDPKGSDFKINPILLPRELASV